MLAIVIIACDKGLQATSKAVDGDIEGRVVFVGEDDVEVSVQLRRRKVSKVLRDERQAD